MEEQCPKCGCEEQVEKVNSNFCGVFKWKVCANCTLKVRLFPIYKERKYYHLLHHCWCNYFMRDVKTCTMCNPPDEDGMWERYPYNPFDEPGEMLHELYFPEAVARRQYGLLAVQL